MRQAAKTLFLYFIPLMAMALSIAVGVSHSAGIGDRTSAALAATGAWQQNNNTQIPYGTDIEYIWNDGWRENGTYSLDNNGQHTVTLNALTQRAPSGGGVNSSACAPTTTVHGDFVWTIAQQGGEVIGGSMEFLPSSVEQSGCEFGGTYP